MSAWIPGEVRPLHELQLMSSQALHTPHWKHALVHALKGLALGWVTALLLVGASYTVWPGLKAAGEDAGLRVSVALDGWWRQTLGTPFVRGTREDTTALTLLDLDSGAEDGEYCTARARLAESDRPCDPLERIDRGLLAAVVTRLSGYGVRAIVLDIDLAEADGRPDARLTGALKAAAAAGVAVYYPAPLRYWTSENGHLRYTPAADVYAVPPLVRAGVALPEPGDPVRRYARCVRTADAWQPTLPWLTAEHLAGREAECGATAAETAPRIVYTLPSLEHPRDAPALIENAADYAHWKAYRALWDRCLATKLADNDATCSQATTWHDRVVVVGASNPARRDRHYTPLGDMAGAEVVANATRSFLLFPDYHDKPFYKALLIKMLIVLACGVLWFAYFFHADRAPPCRKLVYALTGLALASALWLAWPLAIAASLAAGLLWAAQRQQRLASLCTRCGDSPPVRLVARFALFASTVILVIALALWLSYKPNSPTPSLDILIPVLAVGIEIYVETMENLLHRMQALLEGWLHIRSTHAPEHEEKP